MPDIIIKNPYIHTHRETNGVTAPQASRLWESQNPIYPGMDHTHGIELADYPLKNNNRVPD